MNPAEVPKPPRGAQVWPMSVEAYHVLGETGLVPKRTELLYGFVYHKMSRSPLHSFLVQWLQEHLLNNLPGGFLVRTEQPIVCADSEPEPDLSLVRATLGDLRRAHPHTAELVIEICVSSADYDRSKLAAYAGAGVKECWLVLASEKQIEIHRGPQGHRYAERALCGPGGSAACGSVPITVDLNRLFDA